MHSFIYAHVSALYGKERIWSGWTDDKYPEQKGLVLWSWNNSEIIMHIQKVTKISVLNLEHYYWQDISNSMVTLLKIIPTMYCVYTFGKSG